MVQTVCPDSLLKTQDRGVAGWPGHCAGIQSDLSRLEKSRNFMKFSRGKWKPAPGKEQSHALLYSEGCPVGKELHRKGLGVPARCEAENEPATKKANTFAVALAAKKANGVLGHSRQSIAAGPGRWPFPLIDAGEAISEGLCLVLSVQKGRGYTGERPAKGLKDA